MRVCIQINISSLFQKDFIRKCFFLSSAYEEMNK